MEGKTSTIDIATLMQKRLVLTGSTLRGRPLPELALIAQGLDRVIWPLLAAGKITPVIDNTFPLERAADAHKHLEQGHHVGKIVLTV
jgi:NADPH:quinone reductase-like Zn-dependent oxidoreductase